MQQNQQKEPQNEDQLQAWFIKYINQHHMNLYQCMWAVPNSALGNIGTDEQRKRRMEILVATGLRAGVWDLHIFCHGHYHIIETKFGNNKLTVNRPVKIKGIVVRIIQGQKEWGERMAKNGAIRHVYRTIEQGMQLAKELGEFHAAIDKYMALPSFLQVSAPIPPETWVWSEK